MSSPSTGFATPLKVLVQHFNDHSHIRRIEHAQLFKTGEIDVDLLNLAELTCSETLKRNAVVTVSAICMSHNMAAGRVEPVFLTRDSNGDPQGTFFASVFKSLTL